MNIPRVNRAGAAVFVRRAGLLLLIVCCLVVPVVSIAVHVLDARHPSATQNFCPDPTTPCELPQVIPTGRP
ncbi:MAG TPA: hypothetical protein VFN97_09265 [Actinospica sp.]|nr:hypothetical protein [Actinospica sp.]